MAMRAKSEMRVYFATVNISNLEKPALDVLVGTYEYIVKRKVSSHNRRILRKREFMERKKGGGEEGGERRSEGAEGYEIDYRSGKRLSEKGREKEKQDLYASCKKDKQNAESKVEESLPSPFPPNTPSRIRALPRQVPTTYFISLPKYHSRRDISNKN